MPRASDMCGTLRDKSICSEAIKLDIRNYFKEFGYIKQ